VIQFGKAPECRFYFNLAGVPCNAQYVVITLQFSEM
jgi:hypothetical protein